MKFNSLATAALIVGTSVTDAFVINSSRARMTSMSISAASDVDFDSILGEGSSYESAANELKSEDSTAPVIRVPDGSPAASVTMASAVASPDLYGDDLALEDDISVEEDAFMEETAVSASDPLLNNEILKRQHEKKVLKEQRKAAGGMMRYVKNPLLLVKGKDFSDVTLTIFIPAVLSFVAIRKVANIGLGKLTVKADDLYERAASEIAYHVGDYEEMEATYKDYRKKLWFNGAPSYINSQLVKRLAVAYCREVSVTPKSVSSLAYLLNMMKIPDDEAAESFVTACRENPNSMAIASKVLFYSDHVFKAESAKKKMSPLIKQLSLMFGGVEEVQQQQKDMAESAYRDAVAEKGPGQTKLTEGWKVLGLDKDTATSIFEETKKLGFLSRQELFEKDEKDMKEAARAEEQAIRDDLISSVDKDGNLIDPDSDVDPDILITDEDLDKEIEEDDDDDAPASGGAKECGNCGYTMFIAKGREGRFFSSGFTCPQCGAGRDQFKDIEVDL